MLESAYSPNTDKPIVQLTQSSFASRFNAIFSLDHLFSSDLVLDTDFESLLNARRRLAGFLGVSPFNRPFNELAEVHEALAVRNGTRVLVDVVSTFSGPPAVGGIRIAKLAKGTERFTQIGTGLSKADARALIRSGSSGITESQARSILKKLGKGRIDSVGIKTVNQNGNVRLSLERAGAKNGFQRFSFEIGTDGKTLKTVQTAFDDVGNLVRQAPGAAKNNLFDVK